MVLDYSEKKPGRGGADRKPPQKNTARKSSSAPVALLSIAVLLLVFGAGGVSGWFLHKATHKTPPPVAVAQPPKKEEPAQAAPQQPPPDAPLTFYKTLPAGGKGVIGSGLNLKKPEPLAAAQHPAPAAAPAAPAATAPTAPAAPEAASAPEQKPAGQYVVQIASYRNKTEADAAQSKLATKGVAAYVVESKVADKGTWYRVRVGKHLSKPEAEELAGKSGKGAVVLAE